MLLDEKRCISVTTLISKGILRTISANITIGVNFSYGQVCFPNSLYGIYILHQITDFVQDIHVWDVFALNNKMTQVSDTLARRDPVPFFV